MSSNGMIVVTPSDYTISWEHLVGLAQEYYGKVLAEEPKPGKSVAIYFNCDGHADQFKLTLNNNTWLKKQKT